MFSGRGGDGEIITHRSAMSTEAANSRSVDASAICLFYSVAFVLNWLLALPLWFNGQGAHTLLALWMLPLMMLTPAIGGGGLRFSAAFGSANRSHYRSWHRSMAEVSSILGSLGGVR